MEPEKLLKREKKSFELFSKDVERSVKNSRKNQQKLHKENLKFAKIIQSNVLNDSN